MEKKKLPFWFKVVDDLIPYVLPLFCLWLIFVDKGYGFSGRDWSFAADTLLEFWETLPFDVRCVEVICIGVAWSLLSLVFDMIWFWGGIAIFKLKQILHNRKTPR